MAWQTQEANYQNDSTALASAVAVAADGVVGAAIDLGKGRYDVEFTVADYVGGGYADDLMLIVQANTAAATSTWAEIGNLCIGDADGRGVALTSVTGGIVPVINQADYQVRLYAYLNGSAVSATVTAKIRPVASKDA